VPNVLDDFSLLAKSVPFWAKAKTEIVKIVGPGHRLRRRDSDLAVSLISAVAPDKALMRRVTP
jgi:hypothetical protein